MSNNFCTNCGGEITPGAKFCGKCGTLIEEITATATTQTVPAEPVSAYSYQFMLSANYKKGIILSKGCTVIFTDSDVLVALVDHNLMKQHIASVKEEAKGDGFFKKTAAVMKSGYTFSERYFTMSPDEILSEVQGNFSIRNNTVEQIKFKRGSISYGYDDTQTSNPPVLTIKCPGSKYGFTMDSALDSKAFIKTLQNLFPGSYKGPKK